MTHNALAAGEGRRYLLTKRGLYYRPDGQGYTGIKDHAGRYDASEACPESGVEAVHEDGAPEFSPACYDDLALAHLRGQLATMRAENASLLADLTAANAIVASAAEVLQRLANWRKESAEYTDSMDLPRRKMDEAQIIHMEAEAAQWLADREGRSDG